MDQPEISLEDGQESGCLQYASTLLLTFMAAAPQLAWAATSLRDELHLRQSPGQDLCLDTLPLCLGMDLVGQAAARLGDERLSHQLTVCILPQRGEALCQGAVPILRGH